MSAWDIASLIVGLPVAFGFGWLIGDIGTALNSAMIDPDFAAADPRCASPSLQNNINDHRSNGIANGSGGVSFHEQGN